MKRRWIWIGVAAALIVLVGGVYYTRSKPAAQPQRAVDPGFQLILAIRALERTPETQLTKEQIARILPFVKALKDVPPADADAAGAIAQAVRDAFTPEQRSALEEARKRFQERMRTQGAQAGGGGGFGGGEGGGSGASGPGAGAQLNDERRAQFRTRACERMIRVLERRMK
ncbi:MAG: hypothetical protein ACT4P5_19845 [Armatimonadota bacterium]